MKILQRVQEYASFIITIIIAVILAMTMFVLISGADNWRDPQLWVQAGFNTLLQIIIVITWLPEGKKRGYENETYKQNKNAANNKISEAAKADKLDALTAFCKDMTAENVCAWITRRVAKYGVVYSNWTVKEYRLQFNDKIARKVRRIELKAVNRIKEIRPVDVITNTDTVLMHDTKDHTDSLTKWKVLSKVMTSVLLCVVGAFISLDGVQFTVAALLKFFYWILLMCLSIFYALRTGYKLITQERNDYYKRMIVFLTKFEDWQRKHALSTEQEQEKAS